MKIALIAAASENNVIGKANGLPWSLPNDMKFFKNTTWGMPVIMGRKTFESMNGQPLPGRQNIVITTQRDYQAANAVVVKSLSDALFVAGETDCNEVFVIGGGEIFKDALSKADKVYLTRIHAVIDGDTFFPEIKVNEWTLTASRPFKADEKNNFDHTFEVWERK